MPTTIGTANYRSEREARRAYPLDYLDAISKGRIIIGKPDIKPGQRLLVDEEGRYHIETQPDPSSAYQQMIDHLNTLNITQALWWFIENCDRDYPHRSDIFFYLRERYRTEASCPSSDK